MSTTLDHGLAADQGPAHRVGGGFRPHRHCGCIRWIAGTDQQAVDQQGRPRRDGCDPETRQARRRPSRQSSPRWRSHVLYVRGGASISPISLACRLVRWWRLPRCWAPRWASARSASCRTCSSGFFLITEKQYGFGDLVGSSVTARRRRRRHRRGCHAARHQAAHQRR